MDGSPHAFSLGPAGRTPPAWLALLLALGCRGPADNPEPVAAPEPLPGEPAPREPAPDTPTRVSGPPTDGSADDGGIGLGELRTIGHSGSGGWGAQYERDAGAAGKGTAGPARVEPGEIEIRGALAKEAVRRVLDRHANEAKFCYERELPRRPDLAGTVTMTFIVSASGTVQEAAVQASNLGSPAAEDCLVRAVRRWTFPRPKGGGLAVVSFPFALARENDPAGPATE